MSLLDNIRQMQQQGMQEQDIIQSFMEQGYNPKEIEDALNQSKIKAAVGEQPMSTEEMQPSITTQEMPAEMQVPVEGQTPEYMYQTPQAYPQGYEYPQQQPANNEMISEIAEQIIIEKMADVKKTISNLSEFRTIMEAKVSGVDERLRRIESTIEKLQSAILGKIGNYGESIQDIKNEMSMMQDSFSKALNPLMNRLRNKQAEEGIVPTEKEEVQEESIEVPEEKSEEKPVRQKKGNKPSFEDFLRN